MPEPAVHRQFFADREYAFRLTPPLILELERKTATGIGALSRRAFSSDFRHADLLEIVRLGLIGGGTDPEEAAALIAAYAAPAPIMSVYPLAVSILEVLMFGQAQAADLELKEAAE